MKKAVFWVFLGLFLATAVITLLGLIGWVTIKDGYLNSLFTLLIVELISTVIAWARNAEIFEEGPRPDEVCGHWWELIYNHAAIAISHVEIRHISKHRALSLNAKGYGFDGNEVAEWESEIAGLKENGGKLELWYIWKGKEHPNDDAQKQKDFCAYSGVGYLAFNAAKGRPSEGSGWFTSGDIVHHQKIVAKQDAYLRRLTVDEEKSIPAGADHPAIEHALKVYSAWAEKKKLRPINSPGENIDRLSQGASAASI